MDAPSAVGRPAAEEWSNTDIGESEDFDARLFQANDPKAWQRVHEYLLEVARRKK